MAPLAHGNMGRQVRAVALATTGTSGRERGWKGWKDTKVERRHSKVINHNWEDSGWKEGR